MQSKADAGVNGPIILDPDDGTDRTPKGLLHSGSLQIPIKQLAGLLSEREDATQLPLVADTALDVLPSLASVSVVGSPATQYGAEHISADGQQVGHRLAQLGNVRYCNVSGAHVI